MNCSNCFAAIVALAAAVALGARSATQTANVQAALQADITVACTVDGVVVPIAQPIVASLGTAGAAVSAADLFIHPAVVAACSAVKGTPATAVMTSVSVAPTTPAS